MTAPVPDSGICGLWRTSYYCSAATVASKLGLLVKEVGQPDIGIKPRKSEALKYVITSLDY